MEIKTIDDYVDKIYEKYPNVSKKDIRRILKFGWRSIYLSNIYGGDVCITNSKLWMYIGFLRNDALLHFRYYKRKLLSKLRILYKRKKIPWDNYYYFALNDKLYEEYLSQKNKRGRPKKYFKFTGPLMLYKIKGECLLSESNCKYIFRVHYPTDLGFKIFKRHEFKTDLAELIEIREPMKFKDILVQNNDYNIL